VVSKVSPAIVQILVSGYGSAQAHGHTQTARIVRQHAMGSGVIVDPDGYIITNAHVVEGAQRVRVVVSPAGSSSQMEASSHQPPQILDASTLGRHQTADLALLKIEATHMPFISIRDNLRVRQGELVFAIGSPEGLRDSVTMGVVSSVARQTDTNDQMFYVQTDALSIQGTAAVRWSI
jgi:serine protease Do